MMISFCFDRALSSHAVALSRMTNAIMGFTHQACKYRPNPWQATDDDIDQYG
jgi:hypothetical protein